MGNGDFRPIAQAPGSLASDSHGEPGPNPGSTAVGEGECGFPYFWLIINSAIAWPMSA